MTLLPGMSRCKAGTKGKPEGYAVKSLTGKPWVAGQIARPEMQPVRITVTRRRLRLRSLTVNGNYSSE